MLEDWIEFCNDDEKYDYDPLLKLALTHYQFEAIHPFDDGNGRTGRILNILLLNQKGLLEHPVLYLSGYIIRNKNEYYEKIGAVTERFSWKPWIIFILEGIEQTCYYTIDLIEQINVLFDSVKTYILEQSPNYNQEIIKLMFFQPYIKATHIVETPECGIGTRQTATTKLEELRELGMLEKKTVGRETVYINHQLISVLSQ